LAVTDPAVAVKFAVVAPAATVTEAGVVRAALLSVIVTTEPPAGAARDRVTVQVELAPEATLAGEHRRFEIVGSVGGTAMVPLVPETAKEVPSVSAPRRLPSASGTVEWLVAESVIETTATTPLPIALAFIPEATHNADPLAVLQLMVFPEVVRAGPAAKLMAVTSVAAYESAHCNAAGWLPAVALRERLSDKEPPGPPEPEARFKEVV
jgi:hypothetical protein